MVVLCVSRLQGEWHVTGRCGPEPSSDRMTNDGIGRGAAAMVVGQTLVLLFVHAALCSYRSHQRNLWTRATMMSGGILDPAGPIGAAEKLILFDALAIMLAIVVPTIL